MACLRDSWRTSLPVSQQPRNPQPESIPRNRYDKYVLAVAIDGFPSASYSGILNVLDQLAISYRWSTRFIFMDQIDAEKHLAKERRKWAQKTRSFMNQVFNPQGGVVNQDSVQMVAEV